MCGITDQRVALTIESQSGLWGPIRPANGQSNGIPNTTTFGAPGWFCANAAQFGVSNATALQLPFDLHEVRACLAPPAHFRIISTQWPGETPLLNNCAYHNAEAQVLLALTGGVDTKKLGVYFDNANTFGDGHEVTLSFWTAMIDYVDFSFFGLNTRSAAAVNSAFSTRYDYTTIGYPPYAAAGSPTNRTWTTPNLVGT
jgi:hypothetical protein